MAMALMSAFEKRRPRIPLIKKPARGSAGMSQSCCIRKNRFQQRRRDRKKTAKAASRLRGSVLHRVHFVHIQRFTVFEYRQDNGQSYGRFRRGNHHYEKRENVPVDLFELIGKCDEAQVDGIQHQLDRHEYGDDAFSKQKPGDAQCEQDGAQNQIPGQRDAGHGNSFRARTIAPTIAIRIRTDITSNGSRYCVNRAWPKSWAVPPLKPPKCTVEVTGYRRWTK